MSHTPEDITSLRERADGVCTVQPLTYYFSTYCIQVEKEIHIPLIPAGFIGGVAKVSDDKHNTWQARDIKHPGDVSRELQVAGEFHGPSAEELSLLQIDGQ